MRRKASSGSQSGPPEQDVTILYDDGSETVVERKKELEKLTGCTISLDMLTGDLSEVPIYDAIHIAVLQF